MAEKAWKRQERMLAQRLGGERVPVSGRQRGDAPDVRHPLLAIESKRVACVPQWLLTAVAQAVASKRGNQLPVAILRRPGQRYTEALVVMTLGDFEDFFGRVPKD